MPVFQTGYVGSIPISRSGSNLVVIKTQGVLKGYTGDNYSSHYIEDDTWGYLTNWLRWLVSQAKGMGSSPIIPMSTIKSLDIIFELRTI